MTTTMLPKVLLIFALFPATNDKREWTQQPFAHHSIATKTTGLLSSNLPFSWQGSNCFSVIIDSGATISITPFKEDFLSTPIPTDRAVLQGIPKGLMIKGLGMVQWTIPSPNGDPTSFQAQAYYVPKAN